MAKIKTLDIEFYDKVPDPKGRMGDEHVPPVPYVWEQGHFLVHGSDDVLWTDDIEKAIEYMGQEMRRMASEIGPSP